MRLPSPIADGKRCWRSLSIYCRVQKIILIFLMDLGKKKVSAAGGGRQAKEKMGF